MSWCETTQLFHSRTWIKGVVEKKLVSRCMMYGSLDRVILLPVCFVKNFPIFTSIHPRKEIYPAVASKRWYSWNGSSGSINIYPLQLRRMKQSLEASVNTGTWSPSAYSTEYRQILTSRMKEWRHLPINTSKSRFNLSQRRLLKKTKRTTTS